MFHANAHGKSFCFKRFRGNSRQKFVNVGRRVSARQNHRVRQNLFALSATFRNDSAHFFFFRFFRRLVNQKIHAFRSESKLAAKRNDFLPHRTYNRRKFVCSDVRVRVRQNPFVRAKLYKNTVDFSNVAAFLASRVKFAVAESSRAAFAEAIIRFRVQNAIRSQFFHGLRSIFRGFASFNQNRLDSAFQKPKRRIKSRRSRADDDDLFLTVRVFPNGKRFRISVRFFADVDFVAQNDFYRAVPRVD